MHPMAAADCCQSKPALQHRRDSPPISVFLESSMHDQDAPGGRRLGQAALSSRRSARTRALPESLNPAPRYFCLLAVLLTSTFRPVVTSAPANMTLPTKDIARVAPLHLRLHGPLRKVMGSSWPSSSCQKGEEVHESLAREPPSAARTAGARIAVTTTLPTGR